MESHPCRPAAIDPGFEELSEALEILMRRSDTHRGAEFALAEASLSLSGVRAARILILDGDGEIEVAATGPFQRPGEACQPLRIRLPSWSEQLDYLLEVEPQSDTCRVQLEGRLELFARLAGGHLHGFAALRVAEALRLGLARSDQRLQAATHRLLREERTRLLGRLVANTAHELNNPMMGIQGLAEALRLLVADPQPQELITGLLRECQRCSQILACLSAFGEEEEPPEYPTRIHTVLRESVRILNYRLRRNRIAIEEEYAQGDPVLETDAALFRQAILNLLEGILDDLEQIPGTGWIHLQTSIRDDILSIVLKTSPLSASTTGANTSTATRLGLWVVEAIVADIGGAAQIERRAGGGALVAMDLPLNPLVERLEKGLQGCEPTSSIHDAPRIDRRGS